MDGAPNFMAFACTRISARSGWRSTRAMERELQIMQEMGVNAIRTSHNPPAPELLDLCDRMGLVVWDECFDKWDATATLPNGVTVPEHGKKQYDHNSAGYSDPCDVEFSLMEKDRFVAGEFVWTGFDYIGEPSPLFVGDFKLLTKKEDESRISLFGIVDLAGIPKDRYYLYQSHWAPEKNTVHILPHWNWPERVGKKTPVYVYTGGDSAELFLNGKSLPKP